MTSIVSALRVLALLVLRISICHGLPCGNSVASENHIVPVDDYRTSGRAKQTRNILGIAPGDQDPLARVIGDKTAADFGSAKVADQDTIAAREIPFDPRHPGGQKAFAAGDRLCRSRID